MALMGTTTVGGRLPTPPFMAGVTLLAQWVNKQLPANLHMFYKKKNLTYLFLIRLYVTCMLVNLQGEHVDMVTCIARDTGPKPQL
jgi:hypothetical protein